MLASDPREGAPRTEPSVRGVRFVLPMQAGAVVDVIDLEAAHLEWLVRTAAYVAVRDGCIDAPSTVFAVVRPGTIAQWHGPVRCLDGLGVELRDADGRMRSQLEFSRRVLDPFAMARAVHRAAESGTGTVTFASSLHAVDADTDEAPWPVTVPNLPAWSTEALARRAVAQGSPAREWIATFVDPDVLDGLALLERTSRERGVETAARIHARIGFDRETRTFIRILERLVVTRDAIATASTVVSTAGSWGEFLAAAPAAGPSVASHIHVHLHLTETAAPEGNSEAMLSASAEPVISVSDMVSHLVTFVDPLACGLILSLYPDRRVVKLYGYTPRGTLEEEPGYWVLPQHPRRRKT